MENIIIKFVKVKKGSKLDLSKIDFENWENNAETNQLLFCEGIFESRKDFENYQKENYENKSWVVLSNLELKQKIWYIQKTSIWHDDFIIKF